MTNNKKISVAICAFNEEKNIQRCLDSVKWADEIIVVDPGSTDHTPQLAKKYTSKVFNHKNPGFVEPLRNYSIQKATNELVFVIDADEEIPESLANKLISIAGEGMAFAAVEIPRKNIIFGKWIEHAGWWPDYQLRFFKKGKVTWSDKIHSKPVVDGEILRLDQREDFAILHHNYSSISEFLTRMDRYTEIEAEELSEKGEEFSLGDSLTNARSEFLSRFFAREGYKDGTHGVMLSLFEAYSMLLVQAKLWEKEGFPGSDYDGKLADLNKRIGDLQKEIKYWTTDSNIKNEKNPLKKIIKKTKRKFDL